MPDVIPFLTYEDGIAALEWLAEVFGFTETARFTSSDGRLSHGEMSVGAGLDDGGGGAMRITVH